MWQDPIVEEIRQLRQQYAAQFNHDLKAICQDLRERQKKSKRKSSSYHQDLRGKSRQSRRTANPLPNKWLQATRQSGASSLYFFGFGEPLWRGRLSLVVRRQSAGKDN